MKQTGYTVWLDNRIYCHAFTFTSAYKLRVHLLNNGADPVLCYITKDRMDVKGTVAP